MQIRIDKGEKVKIKKLHFHNEKLSKRLRKAEKTK